MEYWRKFDENYIKPTVIHDYPYTVDEHEELSKGIKNVIDETRRRRMRTEKNFGTGNSSKSKK